MRLEPPMAVIMRSGRGSAVRLRLYLTMLWIGSGPPHEISGVAAAWARLLDLDDPTARGARQIRSAMTWLDSHQLIDAAGKSGAGMTIRLRNDLGDGGPYEVPGRRISRAQEAGLDPDRRDFYFRLPEKLWTNGWIHNLSGAALAALLILLRGTTRPNARPTDLVQPTCGRLPIRHLRRDTRQGVRRAPRLRPDRRDDQRHPVRRP